MYDTEVTGETQYATRLPREVDMQICGMLSAVCQQNAVINTHSFVTGNLGLRCEALSPRYATTHGLCFCVSLWYYTSLKLQTYALNDSDH
jgi:hypothetical protein